MDRRITRLSAAISGAIFLSVLFTFLGFTERMAFAQDKPKPVVLRFVADLPPPPHPAGLAMKYFAERLPQVIPGSEARLYYAGSLYTIPEAFEAMRQGNLELTWMQIGKAAPVEPYMMTVVGPGILTTVGAVDSLEKTETYKMLVERLQKRQGVKVFGVGHMSFGMGVGGKKRYAKPDDFTGRKVRSMGPVENASLAAWKASPVVMGFGEVPSALESGVIDGLMTSIGAWIRLREQVPYYTMGGAGAFVGDYYMISASQRWWRRLTPATQKALEQVIAETIQIQKEYNWCVDKMTYDKYGTKDPSKPWIYWMSPEEVGAMTSVAGDAPLRYTKSKTPPEANKWIDNFVKEGRELSKANPPGSSWIEKVDCKKYASVIIIK
ncbi:MAG: TRAP transporter substrate-binding protein DctP [Betaproteobacteria bacterium]|nr:MAG: TRAP transporter substrate-binding protein DctP [Betaproteobacteria bacterium]